MSVTIELPQDIELALREQVKDFDQAAKEACLVEFYRQGKLSHFQLATALGLDRYSTDGVLKQHGVMDEITLDELRQQVANISSKQ